MGARGKARTSECNGGVPRPLNGDYVRELGPQRPAVVTHKFLQKSVALELQIPVERVLYFGNVRGSNALRDADMLLTVGTPGMSDVDAYWMACTAYRGEGSPPSRRMIMQYQPYGGWSDSHGRGREIEVLTFGDSRVAEIYESARRDELVQTIYRCRPFDIEDDETKTRPLTVVLLSAMPVLGLRVDELRFGGNAARAEEATTRLDEAMDAAGAAEESRSARQLARLAGTSEERAQTYLRIVSPTLPGWAAAGGGAEPLGASADGASAAPAQFEGGLTRVLVGQRYRQCPSCSQRPARPDRLCFRCEPDD